MEENHELSVVLQIILYFESITYMLALTCPRLYVSAAKQLQYYPNNLRMQNVNQFY